jgi:2-methylisocitrate lyase-like PEP mutase family enzyme
VEELARVGQSFQGVPQLANMLVGGGRTPILPPAELARLGFAMLAYPTSLIFAVAHAMEKTLAELREGRLASAEQTLSFEQFKHITGLAHWGEIEQRFDATP